MKKTFAFLLTLLLLTDLAVAQLKKEGNLTQSMLSEWSWRLVGPSMPAGRAWRVVGVASNPKIMYVTTAGGGLWKTDNNGTTFRQLFSHESSVSTSEVAIASANSDIVWLGTGEAANTRANSIGDGVYKSTDGGETWSHVGFRDSQMIGGIVIDPMNSDVVIVSVMGHLWGPNKERGVYKTTDGGKTWRQVLFVDETTGFSAIKMDPKNPNILYTAAWQRTRFGGGDMDEAGPNSGIYKSADGGETWKKLTAGLPTADMGKIELAVAYHNTNIIYAAILTGEPGRGGRTSDQGGIFRSDDGGESWVRVNNNMTSYYYDHIYVDPADDETVWMPVFKLLRSKDGGKTFIEVNMRHVHNDLHSMWIDPNDTNHLAVSGDGGVSISYDGANTWQQTVLPIGQFYEVSVDNQQPYHIIGGMQDTGHWLGPHRTYDEEGITMLDWSKLRFNGDGMASATDPRDPNIVYIVQQFGNCSRLDLRTWDRTELKPDDPEALIKKGATHPIRYNWTPAFLLSRHNPDNVYLGSNYLFRINGETGDYDIISPDLSRQQDRSFSGIKDGYHSYGTIFSVAESEMNDKILWAGADDGPLWLSKDAGVSWERVDTSIKDKEAVLGVVAEITPSKFVEERVYVAYDGHARDDMRPHIFRTNNNGKSWEDITGDLPEFGSTYVIKEDPVNPQVLYVGTEFGLFVSVNAGKNWLKLQNNLPTAAIRTMAIQERDGDLVVGTFGSAIWVTDIAPFGEMTEENLARESYLFNCKPAIKYKTRVSYGNTIEELNGDMFFRAENPPVGTFITYYLKDDSHENVELLIKDAKGKIIRRLAGDGHRGIHRVLWDLEDDLTANQEKGRPRGITPSEYYYANLVQPGSYSVTIRTNHGELTKPISVVKESQSEQQSAIRK